MIQGKGVMARRRAKYFPFGNIFQVPCCRQRGAWDRRILLLECDSYGHFAPKGRNYLQGAGNG